jgi:hypothetical protein
MGVHAPMGYAVPPNEVKLKKRINKITHTNIRLRSMQGLNRAQLYKNTDENVIGLTEVLITIGLRFAQMQRIHHSNWFERCIERNLN